MRPACASDFHNSVNCNSHVLRNVSPDRIQALHRHHPRLCSGDILRRLLSVHRSRNGHSSCCGADGRCSRRSKLPSPLRLLPIRSGSHRMVAGESTVFQIEVGLANMAIGVSAGLYIFCTLLLHIRDALHHPGKREDSLPRIANSAIFSLALLGFAFFELRWPCEQRL